MVSAIPLLGCIFDLVGLIGDGGCFYLKFGKRQSIYIHCINPSGKVSQDDGRSKRLDDCDAGFSGIKYRVNFHINLVLSISIFDYHTQLVTWVRHAALQGDGHLGWVAFAQGQTAVF